MRYASVRQALLETYTTRPAPPQCFLLDSWRPPVGIDDKSLGGGTKCHFAAGRIPSIVIYFQNVKVSVFELEFV